MWKGKGLVVTLLLAITGNVLFAPLSLAASRYTWEGDGWYRDVDGHWSANYVYYLWLAKPQVVAGQKSWWRNEARYYYYPDSVATRMWYIQCLMEVFGSLTDQEYRIPGTNVYYNGRRWLVPYANDAARLGLISPTAEFFPEATIRRDEAFSWAIRAAGNKWLADSLSDQEVERLLSYFPDAWQIDPKYRKDVALARKFNIARGDENDYLNPAKPLRRGEAAAIIYRSATVRLEAPKTLLQGAGSAAIRGYHIGFGVIKSWTIRVGKYDASGNFQSVRTWTGSTDTPYAVWDGKDSSGNYVPPGIWTITLDVDYYRKGSLGWYLGRFTAIPVGIEVVQDHRYLNVSLYTSTVPDAGYMYFCPYYYSEAAASLALEYDYSGNWQPIGGPWWQSAAVPGPGSHTARFRGYLFQAGFGWGYFYDTESLTVQPTSVSVWTDKQSFTAGQALSVNVIPSPPAPSWGGYFTPKIYVRRLSDNKLVRTLIGPSVTWDGKDSSGQYCDSGTYRLEAQVTFYQYAPSGTQPQWTRTAYKDVTFIAWEIRDVQVTGITNAPPGNPALPTGTLPVLVTPSSQVTVQCDTSGPAQQVKFRVGSRVYDGTPQYARGSMTNTWTAVVSPGTSHGAVVKLTVELYDSSGVLRKSYGPVDLLVVDGRAVSASSSAAVSGTYAVSGGKAYILIDVVGTLKSGPTVSGFGQSVTAVWDAGRGKYVAVLNVPAGTADGTYTVSVSAVVSLSGWPDRTLTASVNVPVKQERLSLTLSTQRFAPRLGTPLSIYASLRPVTTPALTALTVKNPGGAVVYTRPYSGLPSPLYWDGKDSSGNCCDTGGVYTVTVTVTCTHDPGGGFPVDTIQVAGSTVVQLPNVTTSEDPPGSVIIVH